MLDLAHRPSEEEGLNAGFSDAGICAETLSSDTEECTYSHIFLLMRVCLRFLGNMISKWGKFLPVLSLIWVGPVTSSISGNQLTCSSWGRERLISATGSEEWLEYDLHFIKEGANFLRNTTWCDIGEKWFEGYHGVVAPVNFADGTKWAVKISENNDDLVRAAIRGHRCRRLLERYCPEIPFPNLKSDIWATESGKLIYYFMDWVDGVPLHKDPLFQLRQVLPIENQDNTRLSRDTKASISDISVKQLAGFVYNLTTCPVPFDERTTSSQSLQLTL